MDRLIPLFVLISLVAGVSSVVSAQDDLVLSNCPEGFVPNRERNVVKLAENMPSWIGCEVHDWPATREECTRDSVMAFVQKNLVYPSQAKEMG